MHINLLPFVGLETVLVVAVLAMILWRQAVARSEDDTLHVLHGTISEQTTVATKLEKIDKWGKMLTLVAGVLGLILLVIFLYQTWTSGSTVPPGA
jgi:hypothetical protein